MLKLIRKVLSFCLFFTFVFSSSAIELQNILAADALVRGDFEIAKHNYLNLYSETKDPIYTRQIAIAYASLGDLGTAFQYALLYQNATKDNKDLPTSKIIADSYIHKGEVQKAITLLENIKKQEDSPMVDNALGTLYFNQKQFTRALELLDRYYSFSQDEEALKKILAIYFSQNKNQEALKMLQKALENKWCSEDLCTKSIEVFKQFDRNDIAYKIFNKYYRESPTIQRARFYLQVLINQKNFSEAEKIAKSYPFDRRVLLELYVMQNKFNDASKQALKIFQENKETKFLAWSAIYAYQSKPMISQDELRKVIDLLSQAINDRAVQRQLDKENPNNEDAFFYNFLGYILIDHNVDIKKGMLLVRQALKIAPNSIAYIDSLAWAYYKMGDCTQAQNIFSSIPKDQVMQDADLKKHFELIKKCH